MKRSELDKLIKEALDNAWFIEQDKQVISDLSKAVILALDNVEKALHQLPNNPTQAQEYLTDAKKEVENILRGI